jgi:mRNA-degrading endonuclease toxin of MazEF toxin-antitoxin module
VVALSNDRYNAREPDLFVAGVTSNPSPRPYTVPLDTPQLDEGTMRRPSLVRADKVFSIDQRIVRARFGRVTPATFDQIRHEVQAVMAESS